MAEVHEHDTLVRRLRAMGIPMEILPGGRTALGVLPLRGGPFETSAGARRARELRFLTVGLAHLKCVEPDWLFPLPLVPVLDCDSAEAVERKVRAAWAKRLEATRRAAAELARAGVLAEPEAGGAVLSFPLSLPDRGARGRCIEPGALILPAVGPLSGLPLRRTKDRLFRVSRTPESGVDLEIDVTARLEQLAQVEGRIAERARARRADRALEPPQATRRGGHRVLLVGPGLTGDRRLVEGLRVRGADVVPAATCGEALRAFSRHSFELVMVDARVGRDEGVELIPMLGSLAGVERVPAVLVDDRLREARRAAARSAGAAGYLTRPIDLARAGAGIERLLRSPARRRFKRFPHRLAVREPGSDACTHTLALGRLGMMLHGEDAPPVGALGRYEIALPELGARVRVDAETLYERAGDGQAPPSRGLRFRSFGTGSEELLIRYLGLLEESPARAAQARRPA